jgi:hypothetical protein
MLVGGITGWFVQNLRNYDILGVTSRDPEGEALQSVYVFALVHFSETGVVEGSRGWY